MPLRSQVERAVDNPFIVLVDPHHRCHAPQVAGPRQVGDVAEIHRAVLPFKPDRVEPQWTQLINHVGRVVPGEADNRLAPFQFVFRSVLSHFYTSLFLPGFEFSLFGGT